MYDLVQEKIRRNIRDSVTSRSDEEEDCALVGKGKNAKGKKTQGKAKSNQNHGKKKDLNKIKCFHPHEYGNYATKCPHKKSSKDTTTRAGGDALASQFELDFNFIACMESIARGSEWYLDFSAPYHMIGNNEFFNSLEEKDLQLHINLRVDGRYNTKGIVTITFKRESCSHIHLKDVMYEYGLKKNLIFVVVLEDCGYDMLFSKGKAYLKQISTR